MTTDRQDIQKTWAKLNGLMLRSRPFCVSSLIPGRGPKWTEHPSTGDEFKQAEYYSGPRGKHKVIIAHLYGPDALVRAEKFARQRGLIAQCPPNPTASWYVFGECTLVAYSAPDVTLNWLEWQQ